MSTKNVRGGLSPHLVWTNFLDSGGNKKIDNNFLDRKEMTRGRVMDQSVQTKCGDLSTINLVRSQTTTSSAVLHPVRENSSNGARAHRTSNGIKNILNTLKKLFLDLVFPYECAGCGKEGVLLCADCNKALSWIPPVCFVCGKFVPERDGMPPGKTCKTCRGETRISVFLSPFSYKSPTIRNLIHALKYRRAREGADLLGNFLVSYFSYFKIIVPQSAVIIPVPLHKSRERFRGFNQSVNIASFFSASLGIPCDETIVKKNRATAPQVGLSQDKRLENVKNSFVVVKPENVRKKCVILLDDVKTTGATLEEVALILRRSGAKEIWVITVAH